MTWAVFWPGGPGGRARLMRPRWAILVFGGGTIAIAATWAALRVLEDRQCRALLQATKDDMSAERYGRARSRLNELLARRPDWDEAIYNLGVCELARKRPEAALAAFER